MLLTAAVLLVPVAAVADVTVMVNHLQPKEIQAAADTEQHIVQDMEFKAVVETTVAAEAAEHILFIGQVAAADLV
jgi:hypothetical protein